uniref:Uncharacterized protein n=1 Tax=Acrobeloides nanus TaxID=290746 RepID=A0A914CF40_9BILA
MWSKLQESGIDIGVYGVPKSEPISRKQRKSNAPTTIKEVIQMDSDSDEIQILTPATTPVARGSPAIASESTTLVEIASDSIISESVVETEQSQIEERIQFMVNLVEKLEGDFQNDDESSEAQILQVISSIIEKVAEEEETENESMPITVVQNEAIEDYSATENDEDILENPTEISPIEEGQSFDEGQVEDRVEENFAESLIETDQNNSLLHGDSIGTNETESEQDKKLFNDQEVIKISSSTNLQSSLVDELKVVAQDACEASKRVPISILLQGREFLAFQGHLYRHKTKAKRANSSTENCTKIWSCIENYRQAEKCLTKLEITDAHTTETAELTQLQHLFPKFNIPEWSIPESKRTLVVNAVQEHNHDQNMDRTEGSIIRYLVMRKAVENPELSETDMFEAFQALTPKSSEKNSSLKASLKAFREELMRLREQGMDIYAGIDHRNQLAMSGTIEKEHKTVVEKIKNQEESSEALRNLETSTQIDSEDRDMVQEHNCDQDMDSNGSNQTLDEPINMDTTDTLQLAIAGSDSDIEMES